MSYKTKPEFDKIAFKTESESFCSKYKLSKREFEVVLTLLSNVTNSDEIARKLSISTHTVNNHLKSIFEKTHTNSKTEILAAFLKFSSETMAQHKLFSRKPKVLIIDDESAICEYVCLGLQDRGLKVFSTTDPKEARQLIRELNVDVVISDIRMPGTSGMTLLKELREANQFWPYFIFMTGYADYTLEESLHAGATGYIEKPIDLDKLFKMVIENVSENSQEIVSILSGDAETAVTLNGTYKVADHNMGYGGAFIPMDTKLEKQNRLAVGSIVDMTVVPESLSKGIKIKGKVVWYRREESDGLIPGIGVKFLEMGEDDRDEMFRYIRSRKIGAFIPDGSMVQA
jgi:DNA-binding NarL/FixJ family response regulator